MAHRLLELAGLFLKLGTISFGGPAAHLALMEDEVVRRRDWVSRDRFLDLVGATNLIPGPNAVEMAGLVGYCRAGVLGSIVGAVCFTLPAVAITLVLAWSYARYGALPQVDAFLYGIKPAVLAVIFAALWRLGKAALGRWQLVLVGLGVAAASLLGSDQVLALLAGSLAGLILLRATRRGASAAGKTAAAAMAAASIAGSGRTALAATLAGAGAAATAPASVSLWKLGLFFLKVGAVLYGSGYVLVAYLEGGLVGQYDGFGQKELLDSVAIGQLTPGPLLTAATFAGYLIAGVPGAVVATMAIMLPSFVFVAAVNPLIPRLRESRWASLFLDAVNAASIGLMAAVAVTLTRATLVDWPSIAIAIGAAVLALRWRVAPAWLVLGGAAAGYVCGWREFLRRRAISPLSGPDTQ